MCFVLCTWSYNKYKVLSTKLSINNLLNQLMTRSAAGAGVTGLAHFSDCREAMRLNLMFDCTLRHEKARTDQRLVTRPIVARRIAEIANCIEQRFACESSTPGIDAYRLLRDRRRLRSC